MTKVTNIIVLTLIVGCTSVVSLSILHASDCNEYGCYLYEWHLFNANNQRNPIIGKPTVHSGLYTINVGRKKTRLEVYCDMQTDGGGWTVCIITCFSKAHKSNLLVAVCILGACPLTALLPKPPVPHTHEPHLNSSTVSYSNTNVGGAYYKICACFEQKTASVMQIFRNLGLVGWG